MHAHEGGLDTVINCAGISTIGLITDLAASEFRKILDVDLTGGFLVLKHAGRLIRDDGIIVMVASLNARQAAAGLAAFCSARPDWSCWCRWPRWNWAGAGCG